MANIMDYLDWRGDLTLRAAPFNEVDALLLAELSFIDFTGLVPPPGGGSAVPLCEAARAWFDRHDGHAVDMGVLVPDKIPRMMRAMMSAPRFARMGVNSPFERLDLEREEQFAAVTFELEDGTVYVAFRGTDDTLVGWKEDFNLGFLKRIPSQEEAAAYLTRVAALYPAAPIRVGGHSKGGNLAVYAAVHVDEAVQERILGVYNCDGPGFSEPLEGLPEHSRIASRIVTVVPQSSVVGMLLEHEQRFSIVQSVESGVQQHDGFSWQVLGARFVRLSEPSREGRVMDETLDSWAASMNYEQRKIVADALYAVLTGTGARTLSDLTAERAKSASALLRSYKGLDRETRRALTLALRELFKFTAKSVVEDVQQNEGLEFKAKMEEYRRRLSRR